MTLHNPYKATPPVTAVTGKQAVTVRWRLSPAPQETTDFVVEYRLNG